MGLIDFFARAVFLRPARPCAPGLCAVCVFCFKRRIYLHVCNPRVRLRLGVCVFVSPAFASISSGWCRRFQSAQFSCAVCSLRLGIAVFFLWAAAMLDSGPLCGRSLPSSDDAEFAFFFFVSAHIRRSAQLPGRLFFAFSTPARLCLSLFLQFCLRAVGIDEAARVARASVLGVS